MSELKARHIVDVYDSYYAENPFGERSQVYLKSEADKVIAEKDAEIQRLEKLCESYRIDCDNLAISNEQAKRAARTLLKKMNHHKHKRCIAMAKWCASEAYIHEHGSDYDEDLVAWFGKWHKRWLKLAEKFKDGV